LAELGDRILERAVIVSIRTHAIVGIIGSLLLTAGAAQAGPKEVVIVDPLPLPVTVETDPSADCPRTPFQDQGDAATTDSASASVTFSPGVAGQRLVIESFSVFALMEAKDIPFWPHIQTIIDGEHADHLFPLTKHGEVPAAGTFAGAQYFSALHHTRLYSDPETNVRVTVSKTGAVGDMSIRATVSGYLVSTDCPLLGP
jgi:hypothetical protein